MKILQIAAPQFPVPPTRYGPEQLQVHYLTEGLIDQGHEVVLGATGDSKTRAELRSVFPTGSARHFIQRDLVHCATMLRDLAEVDIVHAHCHFSFPLFAHFSPVPSVTTLHEDSAVGDAFPDIPYVAISHNQRSRLRMLNVVDVIPCAVRAADFPLEETKGDYLLFLSRVGPEKGPHLAIELAKMLGMPLKIAGPLPANRGGIAWFRQFIAPNLTEQISYVGPVYGQQKIDLLAGARCLVLPVCREEPFGVVMLEALACGTPVAGMARGAIPEVVQDPQYGFVARTVEELAQKVASIGDISPRACREYVEAEHSVERLVERYCALYARLTG